MREKILLVEDNKALAKLLAKKTESSLGMQVDVAHSMEEAKAFLKHSSDYFIALLDLNLPDAPDGEIVDYVLELGILVIVLTGNIDKKTKALFEEKPIVDYVFKGNMDDVNYIFSMIDRLRKNTQHKVLVVDSAIASMVLFTLHVSSSLPKGLMIKSLAPCFKNLAAMLSSSLEEMAIMPSSCLLFCLRNSNTNSMPLITGIW